MSACPLESGLAYTHRIAAGFATWFNQVQATFRCVDDDRSGRCRAIIVDDSGKEVRFEFAFNRTAQLVLTLQRTGCDAGAALSQTNLLNSLMIAPALLNFKP